MDDFEVVIIFELVFAGKYPRTIRCFKGQVFDVDLIDLESRFGGVGDSWGAVG